MSEQSTGFVIVPDRENDANETKDMLRHIQEQLDYATKLLETLVNTLSLAHKTKNDASDLLKLNSTMLNSLIGNKDFEGKDQIMEMIQKLSDLGSK
jgi:hypothetical protein